MKDLVIVGTGSFATLMKFYITQYDTRKVVAFSVEQAYINGPFFEELPVCPLERLTERYASDTYDVLLAIGAKNMNKLRERLFRFCKDKGYHVASFIHPSCVLSPDTKIGEGNIILENSLTQPFVEIGEGNLFWDNVAITHNDIIGDFNTISGGVGFSGFDTVGNYCYLGKYSMVFDNVTLADYTLVGAGAHVKNDTQEYDVIVPARSVLLEGRKSTDFKV